MRNLMVLCVISLLGGSSIIGQSAPNDSRGAKALFFDSNSGASVSTAPTNTKVIADKTSVAKVPVGKDPIETTRTPVASNPGLMYYLELVKSSGEVLRVTSTRRFHNGDRVRIHFSSNVSGRLTIVQRQPDGRSQVLFPDRRLRDGDSRIVANQDMVVPGEKGWFKFDNAPGEERLMVFLTPDGDSRTNYDDFKPGEMLTSAKTVQLASNVEHQLGSKALSIEVDETSAAPATYVVKPVSQTLSSGPSAAAAQLLATEIVLNHQE
jgi:hypothetical protein